MHIYNSKVQIDFCGHFSVIVFVNIKFHLKETGTVMAKKSEQCKEALGVPVVTFIMYPRALN